jgi:hypothetical protein
MVGRIYDVITVGDGIGGAAFPKAMAEHGAGSRSWSENDDETGPAADARRAKALPLIAQDATRSADVTASGPDCLLDETARRRFFGED